MTGPAVIAGLLAVLAVLVVRVGARRSSVVARGAPRGWRPRRPHRDRRGAAEPEDDLLAFLDVVGSGLRAGRTPSEAARLACGVIDSRATDSGVTHRRATDRGVIHGGPDLGRDPGVVHAIRDGLEHGMPVVGVLDRAARTDPEVRLLAHAWHLSARTGAPLADAVDCAAQVVRARRERDASVRTASAGARSTMRMLTALPFGGPVLAMAVGVDPVTAYVQSPTAWACLGAGAVLVLVGRRWVSSLVTRATSGPVLAAR